MAPIFVAALLLNPVKLVVSSRMLNNIVMKSITVASAYEVCGIQNGKSVPIAGKIERLSNKKR